LPAGIRPRWKPRAAVAPSAEPPAGAPAAPRTPQRPAMASGPIAIPGAHLDGASSDFHGSPTASDLDCGTPQSCPIPIPNGGRSGNHSSRNDPDAARNLRLARKAESARAARLRHKQYVNEMHEQMMLLSSRIRDLERQNAALEESATARVLGQVRAALSAQQNATLLRWLKDAAPVNGDLASAFEACALEDGPVGMGGRLSASMPGGASGRPSAALLAAASSALVPPTPLMVPTGNDAGCMSDQITPGSAPSASRGSPTEAFYGGGPRGAFGHHMGGSGSPAISIPQRAALRRDRMESDDDAVGASFSAGHGPRSLDDIEASQAILSLTSASPPLNPAPGPAVFQRMELQFE